MHQPVPSGYGCTWHVPHFVSQALLQPVSVEAIMPQNDEQSGMLNVASLDLLFAWVPHHA